MAGSTSATAQDDQPTRRPEVCHRMTSTSSYSGFILFSLIVFFVVALRTTDARPSFPIDNQLTAAVQGDTKSDRLASPRSSEMADVFRYVAIRRRRDAGSISVDAHGSTPGPASRLAALHLARNKPSYNSYLHRGGWGGGYGK